MLSRLFKQHLAFCLNLPIVFRESFSRNGLMVINMLCRVVFCADVGEKLKQWAHMIAKGAGMTKKKKGLKAYPKKFLTALYRRMILIREFELRVIEERRAGLIPGLIYASIGQEAAAVGATAALNAGDVISSSHRGLGHFIGKGAAPQQLLAELAARSAGYCAGRSGATHVADAELGILGGNAIVGGGIPIAAGAALAFKLRHEPRLALAFFGDGAANTGAFHEAANLAGIWKLPLILFCENNLYSQGTAQDKQSALTNLAKRASSYGFPGVVVDGNDVLAVFETLQAAAERARDGGGPTFIEAKTYRLRGHYEGDPQVYRSEAEIERWKLHDPLLIYRARLSEAQILDEAESDALYSGVRSQIDAAVDGAKSAPMPQPDTAWQGVYGETHAGLLF